ncbi:MAG TPA: nitrite/sulfite reductase [Desulfuromonadales bacterium]|nr:nitrite/sulfite reductase [Desulfuromonadales bacterium]
MPQLTPLSRLDGIYPQRQAGFFMQRVKLAAGVISADQARTVAAVAARFGQGAIHLTTRGSMEIHWLHEADLLAVKRELAKVGLTSRGACGGAVRGVTCASQGAAGFPVVEVLAARLQKHFTGNPRFERLPKKFKIGVETDTLGRRHLIQDVGLVYSSHTEGVAYFDLYAAGGLGREPQPGFLFEAGVSENRIIPLIEAIARVYAAHSPAGKRLKHLLRDVGEEQFRRLVAQDPSATEELSAQEGLNSNLIHQPPTQRLVVRIPAGELNSRHLITLADHADSWQLGFLMVTADQDIAFHLHESSDPVEAAAELEAAGIQQATINFRTCPGTATCKAGLSATREVVSQLTALISAQGKLLTWAISGCPNSCTQPQLADVGIVSSALVKGEDGERTPRFDLYRSGDAPFGTLVERALTLDELCSRVAGM